MEKVLSDFGVQPILLLAQIVNFLVLLFILKKLLYKPVLEILKKRQDTIAQSLKNSEEIEKRLNELAQEEDKRILKAASEGEKIIKQAQDAGVQIIEESKVKAESIAEKVLAEAHDKLRVEREKMQLEIREHLADLVVSSLSKITGKILTQKDQKRLIDDSVKDLR